MRASCAIHPGDASGEEQTVKEEPTTDRIEVPESDDALLEQCRVETFRSGGPGGQHQNKTESGVRLVHLPSGVVATSRTARSQHRNRELALARLRRKLIARNERRTPRIPTRVPEREKRRRLEDKRRRARRKHLRRPPRPDPED